MSLRRGGESAGVNTYMSEIGDEVLGFATLGLFEFVWTALGLTSELKTVQVLLLSHAECKSGEHISTRSRCAMR